MTALAAPIPTVTGIQTQIRGGVPAMVQTPLHPMPHSGLTEMVTDTETILQEPIPIHVRYRPEPQPKQADWAVRIQTLMATLTLMMHSLPKQPNGVIRILTDTAMKQVDSKLMIALHPLEPHLGTDLDA
jgi:hypothetical protein